MAKGEKPQRQGDLANNGRESDEPGKREIMAAVFFGIRLFKNPTSSDEERGDAAVQATRDADALLGALAQIP
jgi:hypothetical protein